MPHRNVSITSHALYVTLIVAGGAGASPALAQPSPPRRVVTAELVVTATNTGVDAPDTVDAGATTLRLRNQSDSVTAHGIVRVRDGVAPAEGLRAVRVLWRLEPGSPAAVRASLGDFYGGAVFVPPHAEGAVGVTLPPGDYVMYVDEITGRGPRVPASHVRSLHVRARPQLADSNAASGHPSDAAIVVRMADMRFDMPDRVPAGAARWRFENVGPSDHLAFFHRLLPGHSYEEARAWLAKRQGTRPVESDARTVGVHVLSSGVANDVVLDLAPGEYIVACVIGGHHMAGMVRRLIVGRPEAAPDEP
jgi:hypothetical protein